MGIFSSKQKKARMENEEPAPKIVSDLKDTSEALFEKYSKTNIIDDQNGVGPLFTDLGLDIEGCDGFYFSYTLKVQEFGSITKQEFEKYLNIYSISTMDDLKTQIQKSIAQIRETKRSIIGFFTYIYNTAWQDQRSLASEIGEQILQIVLPETISSEITDKFVAFLAQRDSKFSFSKDDWICIPDFLWTYKGGLDSYSADDAWPLLLDAFVSYIK